MRLVTREKNGNNMLELWHFPEGRNCFYGGEWRTYRYELVYKWFSKSGGVLVSDSQMLSKKIALDAQRKGLFESFQLF